MRRQIGPSAPVSTSMKPPHQRLPRKKPPTATCPLCNKVFADAQKVKRHVLAVHEGIKRFECPQCHMRFGAKSSMEAHMYTHMEVKKFPCSLCVRSYATKASYE